MSTKRKLRYNRLFLDTLLPLDILQFERVVDSLLFHELKKLQSQSNCLFCCFTYVARLLLMSTDL